MALRPVPFAPDEWYHCYSRGVEKRKIFLDANDYNRFLHLLYLGNSAPAIHRSNLRGSSPAVILNAERGSPLVAIGAYCLMPNHFHLLLKEIVEGGISTFMQKIGTAYSMYFNIRHEHVGGLFAKPFKSKHIANDRYLRRVAQYIHLNPAELFDAGWKHGRVKNMRALEKKLMHYHYCSLPDYYGVKRIERIILDKDAVDLIKDELPSFTALLKETREYYEEFGER